MIKVKNLWKSYGHSQILKGLNLDVFDGETLVILGRSGVGKSVLLKQIIGLETPDEGTIEFDDPSIAHLNENAVRSQQKRVGMLFQGAALFDSMNIADNVAFYLNQHNTKASPEEIRDQVDAALKMVGLENVQSKLPSELSGGMRKRAALARLIVYRPQILLYDEPTTGLDPITAMQINDLINQIKEDLKATSIVVTHDMRSALEVSDRLAFHHEGKIAQIAPTKDFFKIDDPILHDFFNNAIVDKNEYVNYTKGKGS